MFLHNILIEIIHKYRFDHLLEFYKKYTKLRVSVENFSLREFKIFNNLSFEVRM